MIIAIHAEMGEGSYHYIKPLLAGRKTLVVCNRASEAFLRANWSEFDIGFTTVYKDFPKPEYWEQVFLYDIKLSSASGTLPRYAKLLFERLRYFHVILFRPVLFKDVLLLMRSLP